MNSRAFEKILCLILVFFSQSLKAQKEKPATLWIYLGMQEEAFTWSIAGNAAGKNPDVLSELKWKRVQSAYLAVSGRWYVIKQVYFSGSFTHSFIISGLVSDTDYRGNGRTEISYSDTFHTNAGNTSSWNAVAGTYLMKNQKLVISVDAGYESAAQCYAIRDKNNQENALNSTYQAKWQGPFLRIQSRLDLTRTIQLEATCGYHQVKYNGWGNWNVVDEFQHPVSFRHRAKGYGVQAESRLNVVLCRSFSLAAGGRYFVWETGRGTDRLFLRSGKIENTRLNAVKRKGITLFIAAGVSF